ncbi:MAG: tRNA pseudouridine synthase A [Planctomycetota bacterium]
MASPKSPAPTRYKLTVAYEGTDFSGWQKQEPPDPDSEPDPQTGERPRLQLRTAQHVLERAVREVVRETVNVKGASRTDAGVHAWGQVAAFTSRPEPDKGVGWPAERGTGPLVRALNGRLPPDLLVRHAEIVPLEFDPITGATDKQYSYSIHSSLTRPLWDRRMVYWTVHELDLDRMNAAAAHLVGEHDFVSFAQANHGRLTTVRTVFDCRVLNETTTQVADPKSEVPNRLRLQISGSGFLYNMVRIIAGTLVECGRGRIDPGSIPEILAAKDRGAAGPTLPPEGLRLDWIRHGDHQAGS